MGSAKNRSRWPSQDAARRLLKAEQAQPHVLPKRMSSWGWNTRAAASEEALTAIHRQRFDAWTHCMQGLRQLLGSRATPAGASTDDRFCGERRTCRFEPLKMGN